MPLRQTDGCPRSALFHHRNQTWHYVIKHVPLNVTLAEAKGMEFERRIRANKAYEYVFICFNAIIQCAVWVIQQ